MKPVSMASSRSPSLRCSVTTWVSACPPSRSSASKRVTWAVREATYAAVSPATPEPTTAMRCGVGVAVIAGRPRPRRRRRRRCRPVGSVGSSSASSMLIAAAVAVAGVPAEHHFVVGPAGHDPGRDHHAVVLQPQCVGLAVGCVRHVLGLRGPPCPELSDRYQGRRRATVEVDRDALGVATPRAPARTDCAEARRSSAARRSPRSRSPRPPQRPRETGGLDPADVARGA